MSALTTMLLVSSALVLPLLGQEPGEPVVENVATSARTESSLVPVSESSAVGVGSHLIWRVTVDDPERSGVEFTKPDLAAQLGPAWAVVDGPADQLDPSVPKSQRPDLDQIWTIMPLAGGAATTPALSVTFADGATAVVPSASVEVLPSLGEFEEAPRPLMGFREAPDRRVGNPRAAMLALGGLLVAALGVVLWRRSVKRRRAISAHRAPESTPMELIQALEVSAASPGAKMAGLAPLFRRAFDARPSGSTGGSLSESERQRRAAMTDLDWAEEVKGQGGADAAGLIEELSAYRYGGGEPTTFAVKDALQRAKELIAAAHRAPSPGTPEEAA